MQTHDHEGIFVILEFLSKPNFQWKVILEKNLNYNAYIYINS